jgi:hypothetical protein
MILSNLKYTYRNFRKGAQVLIVSLENGRMGEKEKILWYVS